MELRTQPNESRCALTKMAHKLSLPSCCPISGNPQPGSTLTVEYTPGLFLLEVEALNAYIESYRGGRGEIRSMEGMIQAITQDCADCVRCKVMVTAHLILSPAQSMVVMCAGDPVY